VGFLHGLFAPFRGLSFISQNRLWRYLLGPVLVNIALGIGAFWAMALYWRQEVAPSLSAHPIWAWIGFVGATVLSGVAVFIALHPVLDAIFNDRLSEKVELQVRGTVPKAPFLASSGRALAHGLLKLVLYALAMLVGIVLGIPSVGIGALVGLALGAVFLAYDGFDYPLARRGTGFRGKWAYLALHPGLTLGYGLGATILYLIPMAFVVAPPLAAAGATLVFLEDETKREKKAEKKAQKQAEDAARKNAAVAAATPVAVPTTAEKGNATT